MNDAALTTLQRELARPELFDEGVEAARNACIAGASLASAAIVAAAWYDNPLTGAGALRAAMQSFEGLTPDAAAWQRALGPRLHVETGEVMTPGFGFVSLDQSRLLVEALARLAMRELGKAPAWRAAFFVERLSELGPLCAGLNHAGFMALAAVDLGLGVSQAERRFLSFRTDTAMAEADGVRALGLAYFPFFMREYAYEGPRPEPRTFDLAALRKEVGID